MRQQAAELAIKAMGITFTVYHEQGGSIDRAWPLDIIPRTIAPQGVAPHRGRPAAARRTRSTASSTMSITTSASCADGVYSRRQSSPRPGNFRPMCAGIRPPRGCWAHICGSRPGARQGRHGVRARGQPARAVGRLLHDREPPGRQTRVSRSCSRAPRSCRSTTILRSSTTCCVRSRPARRSSARGRGADAGHLQLRLLRARLSGATDGLRAGRRARSGGAR